MRPLHPGKVKILLIFIFISSCRLFSQSTHPYDLRKFNLGFSMGMDYATYYMKSQPNQVDMTPPRLLKDITLKGKPGINLGLITCFKLAKHWDFRFLPSVSLEQRDFENRFESRKDPSTDSLVTKKVEAAYLNIPFALKFKSDFHEVYRLYVMWGMQYSLNLATNKKVLNDPNLIKVQNWDVTTFFAIGADLYGEKLKLAPEIRYHIGLRQLYVPTKTNFASAISALFSSTVVFCLNFE